MSEQEKAPEAPEVQQVDPRQVARAANACLTVLNHPDGVIPNRVRRDIGGLETLMQGLLGGQLVVVQRVQPQSTEPDPDPEE